MFHRRADAHRLIHNPGVSEPAFTILVTGGAHGIGRQTVLGARARGWRVRVLDIDSCPDGRVVDLSDAAAAEAAVHAEWGEHGPVDALVNNAAVVHRDSILDTSPADFAKVVSLNLTGSFACLRAFAQRCVGAGRPGQVVNVTSAHAVLAQANRSAYAATKAAMESLTRSAATELGHYRIGVFALAPGYTRTEEGRTRLLGDRAAAAGRRVPLGRVIEAGEVAEAALDLASNRYPAMTGQVLRMDGGWSATDVRLEDLR